MEYTGPERRRDGGLATRLGRWLLERAHLVAALIFFTYTILGVVAWGVTSTNQRTKEQLLKVERILAHNQRVIDDLEATQDLIQDCTTPGGECFEKQLESEAVVGAFNALRDSLVDTFGCALLLPPAERTEENLAGCGIVRREGR